MSTNKLIGLSSAALVLLGATTAQTFEIFIPFPKKEPIHETITADALSQIATTTSTAQIINFSPLAVYQIVIGNIATDLFSPNDKPKHFDDDMLQSGSSRLIAGLQTVIQKLADSGDGEDARSELGSLLHTLQDFYAHSNFVDITPFPSTGIESRLGRFPISGVPDAESCPLSQSVLDLDLKELTTGYFSLPQTLPNGLCGRNSSRQVRSWWIVVPMSWDQQRQSWQVSSLSCYRLGHNTYRRIREAAD